MSDKPKIGDSILHSGHLGSGSLENLFDDVGEIGSFGELMQALLEMFEKMGLFERQNRDPAAPEVGQDKSPQELFKDLGVELGQAAAGDNPNEAVEQALDTFIDQNADKLGISETEKEAFKTRMKTEIGKVDMSGADWNKAAQDMQASLTDDAVSPVAKVTSEDETIQYGNAVGIGDVEFHGESVSLYSMDEHGHMNVVGQKSIADLKTELGDGFKVEVVKVESDDLQVGESVVENQGYYVSNDAGVGYYLDAEALDLSETNPDLIASMDAVPEQAPILQGPGSPGFKVDPNLGMGAPTPNSPGMVA